MPPSMSARGNDATDLTKDDLTDQVIATLYDIVRRAQSSRDQSSRALFAAYSAVLQEQGRKPGDDAVLHRFLFLLQKHRQPGDDLVQRFGRVLKDVFGFEVEMNDDGEGLEVTASFDATRTEAQPSRYSRRGSLDSFLDGTADKVAGTDYGHVSDRPRRHSQLPVRPSRGQRRSVSGPHPSFPKRNSSVSSRLSIQVQRRSPAVLTQATVHDADSESTDRTTSLDLSHVQIPGVNAPIPDDLHHVRDHGRYVPEPYRPSETRLLDEAETFEEQRLHRVTRQCIHAWRHHTQEHMSIHHDRENLATAFRHKILLKASFPLLHRTALARHSARETNRFFTRLEGRADKARALFLLTKAFTHWAKSAEDEVQRTSVARRHILRTKFFNGWRDITAVNELKIQHFVLGNFLRKWMAKTGNVHKQCNFAVAFYEKHLVRNAYHEWMFRFFDSAAPAWHNDKMKKVTLRKLDEIAKVLRERGSWVTVQYDRSILDKSIKKWQQKTAAIQAQHLQAEEHQRTIQLSSIFQTLQRQTQLGPPLRSFQARLDDSRARAAFLSWRKNTQLSQQARNVDRLRILRNAYTAWNDQLRSKVVKDCINERIIIRILYQWTLASRVSLFQRVHDRQLKESKFLGWVTKTNKRTNTLDAAERRFLTFKRNQLLRTALRRMELIASEKRREEFAVSTEYQQKLKQRIFDKLKEKHHHFQQLNLWTKDARFYVLSKRTLKTWGEVTQLARRNRRRETYAHVRRTLKTNLVRKLFGVWRDRTHSVTTSGQQASEVLRNRVFYNARIQLHQWLDRSNSLCHLNDEAMRRYGNRITARHLKTWFSRLGALHALNSQAIALRQESTEIAATSALKKLGWRLWNLQRKEENAKALYGRNFEKHVRAMIRYWFEQMAEQRAEKRTAASPTPRSRSRSRSARGEDGNQRNNDEASVLATIGDEPQQLEGWTAFDETALDVNNDLGHLLNLTPERQRSTNPYRRPPSITRLASTLRQNTTFDPSALPPLTSDTDLEPEETFWSSTPLPPPPGNPTTAPSHPFASSISNSSFPKPKPGYLKTPSKRSLARAKRPDLGTAAAASPEKTGLHSPVRREASLAAGLDAGRGELERQRGVGLRLGTMSAPPARMGGRLGGLGGSGGGVTSFQRRLKEGGFGATVGVGGSAMKGERTRARTKAKVGFGDLAEIGSD